MAMTMPGTPGLTDFAQIQQDEISVLQSIFMEDFCEGEAKASAWKKPGERTFSLVLKPTTSSDEGFATTLTTTLPHTYPKSSPRCSLDYGAEISAVVKQSVEATVKSILAASIGSEVIFELATAIQEKLDQAVATSAHLQTLPALDEERALQEAESQKAFRSAQEAEEQKQQAADDEEERSLEEMVSKEKRRLMRQAKKDEKAQGPGQARQVAGGLTFDQDVRAKDSTGAILTFRTVCDRIEFRRTPLDQVFTVRTAESDRASQRFLALKECIIPSGGREDRIKKMVQSLEADLDQLIKLPEHQGISRPLAFRIRRKSTDSPAPGWTIAILEELASKGSINDILESLGKLEVASVKSWTLQIIDSLEFLHGHGIVHARLHSGNVLLVRTLGGHTIPRLTDVSYQRTLHSADQGNAKFSSEISALWYAPESASKTEEKPASTQDIWDLGVLMVQMMFGLDVQREFASPDALMDSVNLSLSLEDLLSKIFKHTPRERPTAFGLRPSEFLRNDDLVLQPASSPDLSRMTSLNPPITPRSWRPRGESFSHSAMLPAMSSRYLTDFVEEGRLGRGSFGSVVRARNRLDGRLYAVKKVHASSREALETVIGETIMLSKMNHVNVVRYFTAWIETDGRPVDSDSENSQSDSDSDPSLSRIPESNPAVSSVQFGFSNSGLDIMTADNGNVEFGYDSEDDEDEEAEDEDDDDHEQDEPDQRADPIKGGRAPPTEHREPGRGDTSPNQEQKRRRRSSVTSRSTMYIQMEICERQTLRDLIAADLSSNTDEIWRIFRQILEGLVHVHSTGVIHRDLKPDNVFIDEFDNVRIGDFGLARPGDRHTLTASKSKGWINPSMSRDVGTSMYMAPEVDSGIYNEKADMYALGLMLFEMSYPLKMKTGMERAKIMLALRKWSRELPAVFDEAEYATKKEIILALVNHQVSDRPSSAELLGSGKVPVKFQDETFTSAIQAASDPEAPLHKPLIAALFKASDGSANTAKNYTYDLEVGSKSTTHDLAIQGMAREKLAGIFQRHGAVESPRPVLIPASKTYSGAVVRLLTSSGNMVHLPFDLTLPHARMLAKQENLANIPRKSFAFGTVYREAPAGQHPHVHPEVDFDIVSDDDADLALREAEVIKVMDEILDAFPSLTSKPVCYQVNHARLLHRILQFCNIPDSQMGAVKDVISRLHTHDWNWAKVRAELRAPIIGVASTSLDDLMLFDFQATCEDAIPKLRAILGDAADLESTFAQLEAVTHYLGLYNVKRKVDINPLSSYGHNFHQDHIFFQCVHDGKKRDPIIVGGRYDKLIDRQSLSTKAGKIHAVGLHMPIERLCTSIAKLQKSTARLSKKASDDASAPWMSRRCDVLIDSFDENLKRSAATKVAGELWDHGISCELSLDTGSLGGTPRKEDHPYSWIVNIKQADSFKVRSMIKKEDVELHSSSLLSYLRGEIRERDKPLDRSKMLHQQHSYHDHRTSTTDREADVRVLASLTKGKKSNRRAIVAEAQVRTRELAHSLLDAPVAAIELKDDLFDALRDTRLSDGEGWRRFIQSAPVGDRAYLTDVQQLLRTMASESKGTSRNAFLYNFRSRACLLYDLGRTT